MPTQHGLRLQAQKEAKQIARRSREIVKKTILPSRGSPSSVDKDQWTVIADMGADGQAGDITVPEVLQTGTKATKISEKGKKKDISIRLDPDEGKIYYTSSKGGIIPIEAIKEMRMGHEASYYRKQFKMPEDLDERWITVIAIIDGNYKTLHFFLETREVFQLWSIALQKLHAVRQGLMSGLGNVEVRRTLWERQYWKGADEEGDQVLDYNDVERLCMRLNIRLPPAQLRVLFTESAGTSGHLDFAAFQRLTKVLKRRHDIESLYATLCEKNGGKLDVDGFTKFLKQTQKSTLSDEAIRSIFSTFAAAQPASPNDPPGFLSLEGFSNFLQSPENSPFSEQGKPIWQDMSHSISEYFISSSHNTYLVGHQLVGVSTIEGYIRALLHSCRSVELDIYDGDTGPVIYHGKTLTSKVSLRDICQAIAKYAFVTSPYPLVISAEVHCGVEQQDMIAEIMMECFGSDLIRAPIDGTTTITVLPSPEQLRGKYLLKAKNHYVVERLAAAQAAHLAQKSNAEKELEITTTSSSEDDSEKLKAGLKNKWNKLRGKDGDSQQGPAKPKKKMSFRLASLLVYTVGVRCHGLSSDQVPYAPEHIFSLSENTANRFIKKNIVDLVKHTHTNLVRIYPKGTRVNSTNYEPHKYWAAGCQVVAINWQTFDVGYMINQSMFQRNGKAGYVLKPQALRPSSLDLMSKRTQHFLDVKVISAQQLPRLRDSKGAEIIEKSIVDPFVEVCLHIPEWSASPFLPESSKVAGVTYSAPTEASATKTSSARTASFSTHVVKNNGFNPVWDKELSIPFDVVGGMLDLIFVRFIVRQRGKDDEGDEPIGVYCIPLGCLEKGYRHLPLHDAQLNQFLFSTLFVRIGIRDVA